MKLSVIFQKMSALALSIMLFMTAVDVRAIDLSDINLSKLNIFKKDQSQVTLSVTPTPAELPESTPSASQTPAPTQEPTEEPTATPAHSETPTPAPKPLGTPKPTAVPTPVPTPNPNGIYYPYREPIHRVEGNGKKLCITINVAWGGDDIPQILDMLDKYDLKITFFLMGRWAELNPEMARMIRDRGHEIGGHSYNHVVPSYGAAWNSVVNDMQKCVSTLENILGFRPPLYRFPSGGYTAPSMALCADLGMIPVQWSADSIDWDETQTEEKASTRIHKELSAFGTDGGIILFHSARPLVLTLVPKLIEEYTQKGYTFVTVSELLYDDNYTVDVGVMKKK